MYVQALLLKMAQTTGEISEAMLTYIASVPHATSSISAKPALSRR